MEDMITLIKLLHFLLALFIFRYGTSYMETIVWTFTELGPKYNHDLSHLWIYHPRARHSFLCLEALPFLRSSDGARVFSLHTPRFR